MEKKPLRIAVIGAGPTTKKIHLPILKRLEKEGSVELFGICDRVLELAKGAAEEFGFKNYWGRAEEAIEHSDVDAVYIFADAATHVRLGKMALEAGKHVFVEKPIAPTFADGLQLAGVAVKSGKILLGGMNRRFQPAFLEIKKEFGDRSFSTMSAEFHKPNLDRAVPYGAKTLLTANAIHAIDGMIFMAGKPPDHVYSEATSIMGKEAQNFSAMLSWNNGPHAILASNNTTGSRAEKYAFHGPEIAFEIVDDVFTVEKPDGSETRNLSAGDDAERRGFLGEHRAFIARIRGEITHASNEYIECLPALRVAELVEEGFKGDIDWSEWATLREGKVTTHAPETVNTASHNTGAKNILILNPQAMKTELPRFEKEGSRLFYADDLKTLSPDDRSSIGAVVTGKGGTPVTDEIFSKLPNLRVIGVHGLSLKKYNVTPALERGIPVVNAAGAYARTVAEFALLLALSGVRGSTRSHDLMRSGGWGVKVEKKTMKARIVDFARTARRNPALRALVPVLLPFWKMTKPALGKEAEKMPTKAKSGLRSFKGRSVGIIGWSANAEAFAKYLQPFECDIRVWSEHAKAEDVQKYGARLTDLSTVLTADVVSLHRGLTDKTRRWFDKSKIDALRPGSVLINIARGEIIDTEALLNRLKKDDITACLDVFDEEPLSKKSPFRKLPNVILSSHIAGSTPEMYQDAGEEVAEKVIDALRGKLSRDAITSLSRYETMS